MAKGRLQIKRFSPPRETDATYQITHEAKHGGEFFIAVEREHLEDFLREKLRLSADSVQELLNKVYQDGHVLIDDVELPESEMASAGMQYI
jgi:hypothetical protein